MRMFGLRDSPSMSCSVLAFQVFPYLWKRSARALLPELFDLVVRKRRHLFQLARWRGRLEKTDRLAGLIADFERSARCCQLRLKLGIDA